MAGTKKMFLKTTVPALLVLMLALHVFIGPAASVSLPHGAGLNGVYYGVRG